MKILMSLGALALVATAGAMPVPASAQHTVVRERTVVRHSGPARRWHTRRVCSYKWRHHRKVRVCRTVRYRR